MSGLRTYDYPSVDMSALIGNNTKKHKRKKKDTRTGFDDSGVYHTFEGTLPADAELMKRAKDLFIALIPYPGVGSIQPRVLIPIIIYLYIRNYAIITLFILGWVLLDLFLYVLFGVWNLGTLFGVSFHDEWNKRLSRMMWWPNKRNSSGSTEEKRGVGATSTGSGNKKAKKSSKRRSTRNKRLDLDVLGPIGLEESPSPRISGEKHIGGFVLQDVGYPDEGNRMYVKHVDILVTAVLINTITCFAALGLAAYAVRVFDMKIFANKSHIGGSIVWQVIISCLIAGLQGGVTAWLGNIVLLILTWALYAPVNGLYTESGASFYAPYIFLSVVYFVALFAFSRVFVWIANRRIYPWPTDNRYIINAVYFIAIGFFVTSLVGVIKTT